MFLLSFISLLIIFEAWSFSVVSIIKKCKLYLYHFKFLIVENHLLILTQFDLLAIFFFFFFIFLFFLLIKFPTFFLLEPQIWQPYPMISVTLSISLFSLICGINSFALFLIRFWYWSHIFLFCFLFRCWCIFFNTSLHFIFLTNRLLQTILHIRT